MFDRKLKGLLMVLIMLAACFSIKGISTANPALWNQITNHMSYLGYRCVVKDEGRRLYCATQKHYPNFSIKEQSGGLLLVSYWTGSEFAKQNRAAFLNLVNSFNLLSIATRYYIDRDSNLALEVWVAGGYEKESFTSAVENFNRDWDRVQTKFGQAILKYIR